MQIYESQAIRLRNLLLAIAEHASGNQALFARQLDIDSTYVSQLVNQHRNIGTKSARKIEARLKKPVGWLDTPQPELWERRGIRIEPKEEDRGPPDEKREYLQAQVAKLDDADVQTITTLVESLLDKAHKR